MLTEGYIYKTELHLHTSPASICSEIPPERAVEIYKNLGYHSIVVCNHFIPQMPYMDDKQKCLSTYLADYDKALEAGQKCGLNVILGCEIRFSENSNDYLLFGIGRETLNMAYDYLQEGIEAFSKAFRSADRLLIQAHPFRNGMIEVNPCLLDGIETFNIHPHHNSRVALATKYAKQHQLIPTVGTDYHHPGHEGLSALLTKMELKTAEDIVRVLRSGNYLFDIGGSILAP